MLFQLCFAIGPQADDNGVALYLPSGACQGGRRHGKFGDHRICQVGKRRVAQLLAWKPGMQGHMAHAVDP